MLDLIQPKFKLPPNMKNAKFTSIAPLLLFLGFVIGFLLATVIPKEVSFIGAKLIVLVSIIGISFFGKSIDTILHNHSMEYWTTFSSKGKWYFIATRYIVLRGIVLFLLFVFPLLVSVRLSVIVLFAAVCGYIFFAVFLSYFGIEEWKRCEHENVIRSLKETGERLRAVQN